MLRVGYYGNMSSVLSFKDRSIRVLDFGQEGRRVSQLKRHLAKEPRLLWNQPPLVRNKSRRSGCARQVREDLRCKSVDRICCFIWTESPLDILLQSTRQKKDFLSRIGISNYMGACNRRGRLSCFPFINCFSSSAKW